MKGSTEMISNLTFVGVDIKNGREMPRSGEEDMDIFLLVWIV